MMGMMRERENPVEDRFEGSDGMVREQAVGNRQCTRQEAGRMLRDDRDARANRLSASIAQEVLDNSRQSNDTYPNADIASRVQIVATIYVFHVAVRPIFSLPCSRVGALQKLFFLLL